MGDEQNLDGLKYKGGLEFLNENDEDNLNTNIDDAELKHNPVFNYLGTTFDKEGGRGLILNSLDVLENNERYTKNWPKH